MRRSYARNSAAAVKPKNFRLIFLVFLLAFAVRAAFPDTSYFSWDESVYMLHGKLFSGQEVGYSETFLRPPLLPLLLSPFAGLPQHRYELASRLLVAFLNSLVGFPCFFPFRRCLWQEGIAHCSFFGCGFAGSFVEQPLDTH